jgi:holin-like protein
VSPLLAGLTWLLVFQSAGEALALATGVPVPGPVVGLALLLVALRLRDGRDTAADAPLGVAADGLAKHLSLLFVPAGVGVMLHAARLVDEGAALAVALVASTVLALAATGLTFQWLLRRAARDGQAGSDRT